MNSMNLIGKFISNFRDFYNDINAATLTGAIDVIVVEQPDGKFTCSPFHVRFGKLGVLRSREKVVDIEINGEALDIHMKLGESGEAFFVEEVTNDIDGNEEEIPQHLACSPIPSHDELQAWAGTISSCRLRNWQQGAKRFVAESIADQKDTVRKLSIAAGEFRPIDNDDDDDVDVDDVTDIKANNKKINNIKTDCLLPTRIGDEDGVSSHSSSTSLNNQGGGGGKRKRRKKGGAGRRKGSTVKVSEPAAESVPVQDPIVNKPSEIINDSFNAAIHRVSLTAQETDIHFFSDTEITPGCRADESRPSSPIVSDTEAEQQRRLDGSANGPSATPAQSWKWGELPSPLVPPASPVSEKDAPMCENTANAIVSPSNVAAAAAHQRSRLSGMFSFMKKRHQQQDGSNAGGPGGIYLSELNADELDPEVAALYFPHSYRGAAVGGLIPQGEGECHAEDDAESGNGPSIPQSPSSQSPHPVDWSPSKCDYLDVAMSLCGRTKESDEVSEELFLKHMVSYDDFVANPMMIDNPNLVVKIGGKFYNWRMACPLIMSMAIFRKSLPQPVVEILSTELMPKMIIKDEEKVKQPAAAVGYSWFTWRKSNDEKQHPNMFDISPDSKIEPLEIPQEIKEDTEKGYAGSSSSDDSDSLQQQQQPLNSSHKNKLQKERRFQQLTGDKFRKTLRLTSEQIASLNLKDGANEVEFSVTTAYQGTTRCKCHIYKWRFDDKVVISDIDGTITKSDVLGHVLPIVGKDWAQSGVAQLFTKIKNNGYKLLYLSARAIGQARVTRDYLKSIKQGDLSLPDGPLLLNPTSLISAFHREVIERKPEEFKISCLKDIAALFPSEGNPFYAGYGNRVNDVFAYRAVGIPIVRIFTINYKGELKHELTQTFQSSYSGMSHLVDEMFPPPIAEDLTGEYGNFIYWRDPIPEVEFEKAA